jgi:hypothetical protein
MVARNSAAVVLTLLLAGCAGMDGSSCGSGNWYDVGWRDARFKVQNRGNVYAQQCGSVDIAAYEQGYREGRWEYPDRTP